MWRRCRIGVARAPQKCCESPTLAVLLLNEPLFISQPVMSHSQLPTTIAPSRGLEMAPEASAPSAWRGNDEGDAGGGINVARYLNALSRFKWLLLVFVLVGIGAGFALSKVVKPSYEVQATIKLEQSGGSTESNNRGPIQAEELLRSSGWQDLFRSFAIADPVVIDLGLFVEPDRSADSTLFKAFRVEQQRLRTGDYTLKVDGSRYALLLGGGIEVERGAIGDSIGRDLGFLWQPTAQLLDGRSTVDFNVKMPREASAELIKKLKLGMQDGSPFLLLTLKDENPQRAAQTLNAWVEQFVVTATRLKRQRVTQVADILEGQRESAARDLQQAEAELENFRVRTVTEPNEKQSIAPGLEMTTNPVFENYFRNKTLAENYQRDRIALEGVMARYRAGSPITTEAVLSVAAAATDPAAEILRKLLVERNEREVALRRMRESATDEFQPVREAIAAFQTLQTMSIPRALEAYITQLRQREDQLNQTIAQSSKDLRGIPSRTIEEQRLKRRVEVNELLYKSLNIKAAEAKLAEAATTPDVRVLVAAVPPLKPTVNTAPMLIAGGAVVALLLGIGLAILLDHLDKRFRYPEQATNDLGLFVLGVVPTIASKGKKRQAEQAAQVVESFRTIRMNVRYSAVGPRGLCVTITSPCPNDGKSLVAANLALSFAEAGARTLLIDGDIRRGELGKTFGVRAQPGLVEYLDGTALIAEVLYPTRSHPNLTLMPGGARRRRGPELLATSRLSQLVAQMAMDYDVVIVDSPPLGAGFDAYALSAATGNMALVLRAGITDRKMAEAKLAILDTLPVRIVGAVLNGMELSGSYQYYAYDPTGDVDEDEEFDMIDEPEEEERMLPGRRR